MPISPAFAVAITTGIVRVGGGFCPWPAARNGVSSDLVNRAYPTTAKTQATKSPSTQRLSNVANLTGSGISSFLGSSENVVIIGLYNGPYASRLASTFVYLSRSLVVCK